MGHPNALIGYTGFVGSSLLRQTAFERTYRSTNIAEIRGGSFGTVVCAGAPAQKWIANREPDEDRRRIEALIDPLRQIACERFVLISTVDVFTDPAGVDESSEVSLDGLHAYGRHRYLLEEFVRERFARHLILRLPGLVGPGLRKNAIFDLLNDNNLHTVDSRGVFQFYPMVNLWYDIATALRAGLDLVHLTAEPISVAEVARSGFGRDFENTCLPTPASYDLRSRYADAFGGRGEYQYARRDTLLAIRAYAQTEPVTIKPRGVGA